MFADKVFSVYTGCCRECFSVDYSINYPVVHSKTAGKICQGKSQFLPCPVEQNGVKLEVTLAIRPAVMY